MELLNIDLFNLLMVEPSTRQFTGTVHRGYLVHRATAANLRAIGDKPAGERYWSVPLAFASTSLDARVAERFAAAELADQTRTRVPVKLTVHVGSLSDYWLDHYASRFPDSVVTSLCAVPLRGVSAFPEEEEVLLRGPFYEVVQVIDHPDGSLALVLVMANANRDHPSTSRIPREDVELARSAMSLMSNEVRCRLAIELAESQLDIDPAPYRLQLEAVERELVGLFGAAPPTGYFDPESMRGAPLEHGDLLDAARRHYRSL